MNIGVLGGTFDPIHMGHLIIAEEVRARLDLAEVLLVPAGQPWLKLNNANAISPAEHRVAMLRLAIADEPAFKLSTMEIDRPGPSYTVDTMAELRNQIGAEGKLYFILGWDNLNQLPRWHQPLRLVNLCHLVPVRRVGFASPDLEALEAAVPGLAKSLVMLDTPQIEISASEIRARVARGLSIHQLVPEPVERYIIEHGLYVKPSGG
jgi:nicotinate-nucleotide adenylyltransferase